MGRCPITKAAGTGNSIISTAIKNYSGTLDVETGTMTLHPQNRVDYHETFTGGTFNVAAGATLGLTGGVTDNNNYTGTYTGSGAGTVSLKSGTLSIGSDGATFNFDPGLFQWSGGTIDGSLTNAGFLRWSGGTINVGAGSLTNAKKGSLTLTGSGTEYLSGSYGSSNTLVNQGTIVQADPGKLSLLGSLSNSGDVTIAGTLTAVGDYTQTGGTTTLAGGTLSAFNDNLNGGALSGNGTVATNLNNTAGQINAGGTGTAGVIAITGNYTQGASGVLNIDIGGTGNDQFDRLNVSGTATLGGTINASLVNNFTPAAGQTFQDVIDFASKSGDSRPRTSPWAITTTLAT